MPSLQRIHHNGQLAAIVIAGQAIIDDTLPAAAVPTVQAKCLYALEIDDGQRAGPYTDADALMYALLAANVKPRLTQDIESPEAEAER
jgi:hypothetical protein